jgi:hypothetical protein
VATDLEYLNATDANTLIAKTLEAVRLLNGLIRHYERKRA